MTKAIALWAALLVLATFPMPGASPSANTDDYAGINTGTDAVTDTSTVTDPYTGTDTGTDTGTGTDTVAETLPCRICDFDFSAYAGPLAEDEVIGLLRALNDEFHAWAVYDQVITDHGDVTPFTNIRRSEQRHIEHLTPLFDSYVIAPIPGNPWPGDVPSFESREAACVAGVEAEIANVELYDEIFDSTERQDILDVYEMLRRASQENHLRAFQRCADGGGGQGNGGGPGPGGGQGHDHSRVMLPLALSLGP